MKMLVAVWCVLAGLYLLFAGTVSATEIGAGLVLVTLTTLFMLVAQAGKNRPLRLRPAPRVLWGPLVSVITDSVKVAGVLVRVLGRRPPGPVGQVSRQPFRQGGQDARDAGRRGMVMLSVSLAPNGYGLHVPEGEDVLVMHRLARVPPSPDPEWPV